ncbi:MAG: ATP-binding cassette domain-containing protein [Acetatifactor sp.]|nr:ATP-binding cassette domain-containing protein [Acetatifactor sp.]
MNQKKTLLEVRDLAVSFRMYETGLRQRNLQVIKKLSVSLHEGEVVAVVGASGSGKSVLAHAVLGILPSNAIISGEIRYQGELVTDELRRNKLGTEIVMIPQSVTYLDPLMKVGRQVRGTKGTKEQQEKAFERYHLKKEVAKAYPFQLSGGMTRRVLVTTAVISGAKLILADEPTPGLGEEDALETMKNFRELADAGAGVLMITHDVDVALQAADTIVVFRDGMTIDQCTKEQFLAGKEALHHPYTRALWAALPQNGFTVPASEEEWRG